MKILHILDHSLPLHSGYSFRSQNILKAQRALGYDPVVVTSSKHEESLQKPNTGEDIINGFKYYRSGAIKHLPIFFANETRLMYRLFRRILEVAKIEQPKLIHAHSPILNAYPAIKAGRQLGLPVVYEIRAFWEDAGVDHGSYREGSWKYNLIKAAETRVCSRVEQVAVLCEGLKKDLEKRNLRADKITPVYNGVNPDDFHPVDADDEYIQEWGLSGKTVIGFVGSFYRYEGLNLLVDAFYRIANERDAILLLVGGGETEHELRQKIQHLGLADKVVMPGRIPHERIPGVYAMIDVLVYPRYSMRLTELVTPLKPLEAMAMGKTLVASDVGGHRELIKHAENGLLFPAGDVEALIDMIKTILDNSKLKNDLTENARNWVINNQNWEKTTEVYVNIYAKALG